MSAGRLQRAPSARSAGKGGGRHCADHRPGGQERLAQAQAALARGEIPRLVTAIAARQLEQAWIARFDERIRDIGSLYHPGTAEVLRVAEWAPFRSTDDETLQLMQMLNVGFLDRASQATLPHNELSRYQIAAGGLGWGKPRQGLLLEARCAGHLAEFVDQGFDTRPADAGGAAAPAGRPGAPGGRGCGHGHRGAGVAHRLGRSQPWPTSPMNGAGPIATPRCCRAW